MATATRKKPARQKLPVDQQLDRYEAVFGEIKSFVDVIREQDQELREAEEAMYAAKAAYDEAKKLVREIEGSRDGAKHSLLRYLSPPDGSDILPLFDRMHEADEELHGAHATEWRREPIGALRLSFDSLAALTAADVMLVGQLQDAVLQRPVDWWENVKGLNEATAAAIVDRLNDFIMERASR